MNSPLFYWNIARIPVATTFLFWWCATLVKFGWEVAPQRFLFEWKSASEKEVAPPCFLFQSKSASHAEVAPLDFYFWTEIRFPRYRRGGRSSHVLSPGAFLRHIRQPTRACTRAKRKNSRLATYTAPAPFSPSLMRRGYYPCRCHKKVKILQGMYSKWGCPYSQKLLFQI